ncbi:MAG: helix-turn-helix transcriptional regulator [Halothiobacillaceae bacterium]
MTAEHTRPERLISLRDVSERVSLKRTAIYARINEGTFPKPVKLGRISRWPESQIDAWIAERIQEGQK